MGEASAEFEVGGDFWLESFVAESGEGVGVVFAGESEVFDEGLWLAVGVVVDLELGSGECVDGEVGSPVEGVGVAVVVVVSDCSVELVGGVFCSGLGVGAGECFVGDDTVGDEVEVSGWVAVVDGDVGGDDGVVGGGFFGVVLGLRVAFGGDLCCHFVDDEVQHGEFCDTSVGPVEDSGDAVGEFALADGGVDAVLVAGELFGPVFELVWGLGDDVVWGVVFDGFVDVGGAGEWVLCHLLVNLSFVAPRFGALCCYFFFVGIILTGLCDVFQIFVCCFCNRWLHRITS